MTVLDLWDLGTHRLWRQVSGWGWAVLMTEAATVSCVKSPLTWELQSVPETPLVSGESWAEPQAESKNAQARASSESTNREDTGWLGSLHHTHHTGHACNGTAVRSTQILTCLSLVPGWWQRELQRPEYSRKTTFVEREKQRGKVGTH